MTTETKTKAIPDLYDGQIVGCAGCVKCGLRAYSKNVTCRSVFSVWPDYFDRTKDHTEQDPRWYQWTAVEAMNNRIQIQPVDGRNFYGTAEWAEATMEDMFNEAVRLQLTPDMIRVVFCLHDWVQDPGTASV